MVSPLYPIFGSFSLQIFLLCIFTQAIECVLDVPLQSRWEPEGSLLLPRTTPHGDELVNFDDMPNCAREKCYPYQASSIGCPDKLTKECFCTDKDNLDCAFLACNPGEEELLEQWHTSICLGTDPARFAEVPRCASKCVSQRNVFKSCSLESWDCFCVTNLLEECLEKCSDADKQKMEKWKTDECVIYNSFQETVSVADPTASSTPTVSDSSNQRPTSTTTSSSTSTATKDSSGDSQMLFSETTIRRTLFTGVIFNLVVLYLW